jgi:hypothetical protein
MPTTSVTIQINTIGTDAGPFTITDDVLGTLATNVTRLQLLGGYVVNADETATEVTVTSAAPCSSSIVIPIDSVPCDVPTPPPPPPPPPGDCKQYVLINVTNTGYIKYTNCTTEEEEYQYIANTGNVTLTNCIDTTTILPGFPLLDIADFTVVNNGVECGEEPPIPPDYYQVELRMNGMYDMNASLILYESPDDSTWTQVVELETVGYEVAIQNYYLTVGYYYYYEVTKTLGAFAYANAYNTVLASDFSPGPIEGAYCGANTVTFPSFQLPDPYQVRSYVSFNGALDSICL